MLQISQLSKQYGQQTVLDIPTLTIQPSEIVGLVGNNGAGKTTLLRLILDLVKATTGYVEIEGSRVDRTTEWKTTTGSFIDSHFLIDFYTPDEFFAFIAEVYRIPENELATRLSDYEQLMNGEILGTRKYLRDFSQGNRQKAGIIGAMLIHPRLLLLDEPFNFLDPSSQMLTAHLVRQLNIRYGTTVLVSSHNLEYIAEISTRILLLEKGELLRDLPNTGGEALDELHGYFRQSPREPSAINL